MPLPCPRGGREGCPLTNDSDDAMLRAVIFDLDGLMVDSEALAMAAWDRVVSRYGHRMTVPFYRTLIGLRVADSARLVCRHFDLPISPDEALAERERLFLASVPARLQARPGLYALLDALTAREIPLAVATSGHRRYVRMALDILGLADRFAAVAMGDEVARGKPAPDVYLLAARRLGVPPADCLALDDAPLGVEAACAAGMRCIAVPSRWTAGQPFPGAARICASLDEVRDFLEHTPFTVRYLAAGGVVVRDGTVLVLYRSSRSEVRLPKGHVEPGEDVRSAAMREVREESGYGNLTVLADLGTQVVEFAHPGRRVVRTERYFLMASSDADPAHGGEAQFEPAWLPWDQALEALTFEPEREWVRRARARAELESNDEWE